MSNNPFKDVLRRHASPDSVPDAVQEKAPEKTVEKKAPVADTPPPSTAERVKMLNALEQENIATATESIAAGLVTQSQAAKIEKQLRKLIGQGEPSRFEELAVEMGFCNRVQIAELQEELRSRTLLKERYVPSPKIYNRALKEGTNNQLMGSRMIAAGLITPAQRERVVEKQQKLAGAGAQIRFGELAVQLGFCTEKELNALTDDIKKRENNPSW